eukprot:gene22010-biopygen30700
MPTLQLIDLLFWKSAPLSLVGLPTTITTLKLPFFRFEPEGETTDPPLDLLPLSKCIDLRVLDISSTRNRVKDLSPLAACKHLEIIIFCKCSAITSLSLLAHCTKLHSVDLRGTAITDLSPLSACKELEDLNILECSALTSLSPLAHCTKLRSVNLGETAITDLSPLSGCKELEMIECPGSRVSDLSPLAHCTNLCSVYLSGTFVTDLSPLSACKELVMVDCMHTCVYDITSLAACPQLVDIICNKDVTGLLMESGVCYHPV